MFECCPNRRRSPEKQMAIKSLDLAKKFLEISINRRCKLSYSVSLWVDSINGVIGARPYRADLDSQAHKHRVSQTSLDLKLLTLQFIETRGR
ncbi:hypothetical protein BgiMline_013003 [Biomphalaria glabrata]|nr:hypothetical protein BgiMline_016817 [Biomphalaria glabrata]